MNAASLVVRIGADVEDFTRGMTKAERAAKKGFNEIGEAGKKMTEFFSVEFALAAGEFAHLAAEAQDASARMDRVFGAASSEMKEHLEALTHVIPETVAGLETLAVKADNLLQGLGYGSEKAAHMSVEMVKLAGDMSAFARVPIADALDALDRGLAGKTKGLLQFGIAIKEQEVHQAAMKRGLLDEHHVLTQLGTAEIVQSLIRERATRITGEAARTAGQASNSFRFLKQSVEEMGVSIGNITLPAVLHVVGALRTMVEAVEHASTSTKLFIFSVGSIAAALGPVAMAVARLGKEIVILQRAVALLSAGEGIAAIVGGIAAAPFAVAIAGIVALAVAFEALRGAVQGYKAIGELIWGASDNDAADAVEKAGDAQRMTAIRALHEKMAKKHDAEKIGPLSMDTRSPLQIFRDKATDTEFGYKYAVDSGGSLIAIMKQMNALHDEAVAKLAAQGGKWNDMAKAAGDAIIKTQKIQDLVALARAMSRPSGDVRGALGDAAMNKTEVALSVASSAKGQEDALLVREAALRMADTFNATRHAVLEFGERVRSSTNTWHTTIASFKQQWGSGSSRGASAKSGLEDAAGAFIQNFTPAGLAAQSFGKVLQGLQPAIDQLIGPLVAFGQILAVEITPVLRPLFEVLKLLGIATALVAEVMYGAAAGIAHVVGGLIVAIGKFISHIPFMGGTGDAIQDFGNGILTLGQSFSNTANDLDHARRRLQDLKFEDAANGIDLLNKAATQASINIPQGFRVKLAEYNAQDRPGAGTGTGAPRPPHDPAPTTITINVNGTTDPKATARAVLAALKQSASERFRDSTRWPQLQTI
jgi:hypothetical protein